MLVRSEKSNPAQVTADPHFTSQTQNFPQASAALNSGKIAFFKITLAVVFVNYSISWFANQHLVLKNNKILSQLQAYKLTEQS